jgi:hypothetical protein
MTAIMGREAAYSGRELTWDDAMKSTRQLGPKDLTIGDYNIPPIARPGTYKFS